MSSPLLQSPRPIDRLLGALVLPFGVVVMAAIPGILWVVAKASGLMLSSTRLVYVTFPYILAGLACVAAIGTVLGAVVGLGKSVLILSALWGRGEELHERATEIAWVTVIVFGVLGALIFHAYKR